VIWKRAGNFPIVMKVWPRLLVCGQSVADACNNKPDRNVLVRLCEVVVNRVPDSALVLVPGGTLITATPEEGRALALTIARHTIHNLQPDLDILKAGRPIYSANPDSLIAASQVVAIEFQTIAAATNYWRN
jgi:hypothetical protein